MTDPIWIPGRPAPKGSRTTGTRKDGRTFSRPASRFEKDWTDSVAWGCVQPSEPLRVPAPYHVSLAFIVEKPARPTHGFPCRADLDKLIRSTLDGMVRGLLLTDDRYVTAIDATVEYGSPTGAFVSVSTASVAPRMAA